VASPAAAPAQNLVSRLLDKINAAGTEVVGAKPNDARSSFTDLTSRDRPGAHYVALDDLDSTLKRQCRTRFPKRMRRLDLDINPTARIHRDPRIRDSAAGLL